jgi:hypothetical protein
LIEQQIQPDILDVPRQMMSVAGEKPACVSLAEAAISDEISACR